MQGQPDNKIKRIHVIYKTHLDVGFTDFSAKVVENYFQSYIPRAIALARQLREIEAPTKFVWTTGSWLIYEYLEQASSADRLKMEEAVALGDITWHALPFTLHSENMDAELFQIGLSLSKELDRRFGKKTIAAKMTDVPGHTRGIVPLLAAAGVQFLHIGVNASSTPPSVPDVFNWQAPGGDEIMVMYHKGSYGDLMIVPGMEDAIAFAHTGDNLGPQSPEEILRGHQEMRERFPGCEIIASTMDAFAARLVEVKANLPVVTQEIGDTWIHGAGTDPRKEAHYRELARLRHEWLAQGHPEHLLRDFSRKLLVVPEHTWGLDLKTHLNDWENYAPADFRAARSRPNYRKMEQSWQEQRGYIDQALACLPEDLQSQALERLSRLQPRHPDTGQYTQLTDLSQPVHLGAFTLSVDPQDGCLNRIDFGEKQVAAAGKGLGKIWYETFTAEDYRRFHQKYSVNKLATRVWSVPDFTKPGIEKIALDHKYFSPRLAWAGVRHDRPANSLLLVLEMPEESWQQFGAPKTFTLEVCCQDSISAIDYCLQWFDKPASRLPEAVWLSFHPVVPQPRRWRMEKLGQWLSPSEVIHNGNRHLHAVGDGGALYKEGTDFLQIQSFDAPLFAPGQPSLLDFNNRQPDLRQGLHFNLYNNLWGTNFPMWYEEDAVFRFRLNLA